MNEQQESIRKHTIGRELPHLSAGLSHAAHEIEPAGGKAGNRPEQDAAERMKDGTVHSTLLAADISAHTARAAYLRGKTARENILQAKNLPAAKNGIKEIPPPVPGTAAPRSAGNGVEIPAPAQRKDRIRRQLFAQRAAAKQAEKEALYKGAGAAQHDLPPRLRHWQQTGKRRLFMQHAARQKLGGQAATSGIPKPRLPSPCPRSISAMRPQPQKAVGRALGRLAAALAKTARAAVRSMTAFIGISGIVLLLVTVAGAAAAIIGSPMGILFADETGDPNAIPIASIVQDVNADFAQAINDIVAAHPECDEVDIQYHYEAGRTWQSYWPEVLAVFAVQANLGEDGNVIVIDTANAQRIQNTFWEMHEITSEVEAVEIEPEEPAEDETEENGETDETEGGEEAAPGPRYWYILHISVNGKTTDEMADNHLFTADQRDILHQLLSDEMRPMLLALCGGAPGGILPGGGAAAGSLQWPLPGYTTISCGFGEPDAISGQPHKGIDIPAPEGTPILAAHDGTVLISGWNDSYGNQVLLDSGAGLSTRYAHMVSTAVSAGETVTTGQVIGYVGSTGESTGDHLHFEVVIDGQRVNGVQHIAKLPNVA